MNGGAQDPKNVPAHGLFWGAVVIAMLAGAAIMIIEIAAGRLISRYLGQSLYTWTSVIGIVLAGMSLGNYVGGRTADRFEPVKLIGALLGLGAVGCFMIPPLNKLAGRWEVLLDLSWPARIFLHTFVAFFIPSALLGCIGPVAAGLALQSGRAPGRTLGAVYAAGAVGSIVGTFAAGYWLIATVGTTPVILLVGSIMALAALFIRSALARAVGLLLCMAGLTLALAPTPALERWTAQAGWRDQPPPGTVFWKESRYQQVAVKTMSADPNHRGMYLDKMLHSEAKVGRPADLLYRYAWVYEAVLDARHPPPAPVRAFVIGGGGYTFPSYLATTRPGSRVEVAEIDPVVTEAAVQAFGFSSMPEIAIHHADARNLVADWIRQRARGYAIEFDYILGDTFNDYSVPFHLTTVEFTRMLADLLAPDGVYMLNMIDRFDSARFLGAIVNTFREVFPEVRVVFCHANLAARGTYVVIAAKHPLDLRGLRERIRARHPAFYGFELDAAQLNDVARRTGSLVLTDDHAPVENLLAKVVALDRPDGTDVRYVRRGLAAAEKGQMTDAIRWFREAVAINESYAPAWYNLGVALMNTGDMDGALQAFGMAIHIEPAYADARNNAAVILAQAGYWAEAQEQLEEVLRIRPDSAIAHNNLGELLAARGQAAAAREHFEKALALEPGMTRARENLSRLAPSPRAESE